MVAPVPAGKQDTSTECGLQSSRINTDPHSQLGQVATGWASDKVGRKWLIVIGMLVQAGGLFLIAAGPTFQSALVGAVLMGASTALVYPTLLAVIGDAASPTWRASAGGVYRFWRDIGYVFGAVTAGLLADRFGAPAAISAVAAPTAASGLLAAYRMHETLPRR